MVLLLQKVQSNQKRLLAVRDVLSVETYLLGEVQKVYRSQGVEIGDKHIEVMVRQMIRKVRVMDPGDTDLLMGTLMDINDFTDANKRCSYRRWSSSDRSPSSYGNYQSLT